MAAPEWGAQRLADGSANGSGPWRVLILSRHEPQAASSRLRTFQYIPALQAAGAEVCNRPFFDAKYLRRLYGTRSRGSADLLRAYALRAAALWDARRHDVVWVEKELLPFAPPWFEGHLARLGVPYVVDYDDATFHTYDEHRRPLIRRWLGRKLEPLLRGADAVTVGNHYLGDYAAAHGAKRVVRVPTVVDLTRYRLGAAVAGAAAQADRPLRVGWIGTPATAKYLELLREPLQRVARTRAVQMVTIGAPAGTDLGVPMEVRPWTEASEVESLASIDVGVMPLPDEPWERGKCAYKLIQYMAMAKPVIASPVGMNRELVTPEFGALAASADDWVRALDTLAADRALGARQGEQGRRCVEGTYSLQAQAPVVVGLLKAAARRR
jgi:glycosyltransferase involved in cell wall biosynthesis